MTRRSVIQIRSLLILQLIIASAISMWLIEHHIFLDNTKPGQGLGMLLVVVASGIVGASLGGWCGRCQLKCIAVGGAIGVAIALAPLIHIVYVHITYL